MTEPKPRPFWWPSIRDVAVIGILSMCVMLFWMIWLQPSLTDNQGFMFLAQSVIVSAFVGGVVAYLFQIQSQRDAKLAQDQVSKAIDALATSQPGQLPGTVTVTPPSEVSITTPDEDLFQPRG